MAQITYTDKVSLNVDPSVANINKVTDSDMNEIKNVVNGNDTLMGDLTTLTTTSKASIVGAINEVNGMFNYSTTEKPVGTWSDGSTIYRQVLSGTTPAGTSSALVSNVDKLIGQHIVVKRNGVNQYHPLSPAMDGYDANHAFPLFLESSSIKLYISNTNYQNQSYYGWIEYTKTS